MTGLEYEHLVAKYLRRHGYHSVSVTQGSGDYGVDVIASKNGHKYAVQCKYYTSAVSLDAVQEAIAGMAMYGCDRAMVVTNNTYTEAAKTLASHNGVVLLENITTAGFSFRFNHLLWLLIGAYIFIAATATSAAFDTIKQQPFWTALFNTITFVPVVTTPFWLWLIVALVKRKIKKIKNKSTIVEYTEPVTKVDTPQVAIKANAEKLKKTIAEIDIDFDIHTVSMLAEIDSVTTSKFQRILKMGYARAARTIDYLLENEYIRHKDGCEQFIYEWTDKAK